MSANAPWSVKGIDPQAREIAKDLARRSGQTLGEWINQMIIDGGKSPSEAQGEPSVPEPARGHEPVRAAEPPRPAYRDPEREERQPARREREPAYEEARESFRDAYDEPPAYRDPYAEPRRRATASLYPEPARRTRFDFDDLGADELTRITRAVERLSARLDSTEHRTTLAVTSVDQSVASVLSRLELIERDQANITGRVEAAVDERLRRLEQDDAGPRQAEAVRSLESSLGKIAVQLFEGEQRTANIFAELRSGLAQTETRTQAAVDGVRAEVREELQGSELRTRAVIGELREEMTGAEHRARAAFAVLREELGETEGRAQGAVEALRTRVDGYETGARAALEQVRGEVRASLEQGAETTRAALDAFRADFAQSEGRTRQTVDDLKNRLERTEQRQAAAPLLPPRPAPEPGVIVEQVVARVAERLGEAETKTSEALRSLESSFSALDARLRAAEASLDPAAAADLERQVGSKFETLAAELTSQMEAARHEVADRLSDVADNRRIEELEGALRDLTRHVEAAERRQTDAIERMGREVMRVTEALNARVAGVEAQAGEAAGRVAEALSARVAGVEAQVGEAVARATEALNARVAEVQAQAGEAVARVSEAVAAKTGGLDPEVVQRTAEALSQRIAAVETQTGDAVERVVGIVEQRLQRADETQADALEKLGGEMARISERLADRIETAERRSAEAIEEVGDKVGEVSERLNQRYERAAAGLAERMRESEERLARVLEETRERLDRRLAEAQRGLTEQFDSRLEARVGDTERGLADRLERKVADARQELAHLLDQRVDETERGLSAKLERSVGETRESFDRRVSETEQGLAERLQRTVDQTRENLDRRVAETERGFADRLEQRVGETAQQFEARVTRTEQGLAGELQRSVNETAQQFEARVRSAERGLSETLAARVGETQRGIADQLDARLGATERGFSERLQNSLAQVSSRVDQVAVERIDEPDPFETTVFTAPNDGFVSARTETAVEDEDELAPFSAFASADGFRHAPLEADDPFIPPPVTVQRQEPAPALLAPEPEPEVQAAEPAPVAAAAAAEDGRDDFHADDEFVTATPGLSARAVAEPAPAPTIEWSEPAPLQKWSFDVEPLETAVEATAPAVDGPGQPEPAEPLELITAAPPASVVETKPAPSLSSTQQMLQAAREAAKAASADGKSGRKPVGKTSSLDLGPPPPMAGLKGSGLRTPTLKLGSNFLSSFRRNKDEKDAGKIRTTALVAGVSFAVSAMAGGAYLLNKKADAAEGGRPGAGGADRPAQTGPAEPPLAASLVVDAPAARTPQIPSVEGAALYRAAVQALNGGDLAGGLSLLRRAAEGNHAPAQLYLAELYETGGAGLTRDPVQARAWTDRAARLGDRKAMHNLALFHVNGEGGPVDVPAAASWFRRAAEGGLVDSQYNLGYLYEQGRGVPASPAEAYKWYLIASRQGDAEARASVERLRPTLSPQALASAERAAAAFRGAAPAPAAPVQTAATVPAAASASARAPALGTPELAAAQQALSQLGYYRGPADGVSSPALRRALAAWQRDAGLPVTGAATPETVRRLETAAG